MANKQAKRRRGDRKDATRVRDIPALQMMMPYLEPKRTDNEAVMNECIDITNILAYIDHKNSQNPEHKYTLFHVLVAMLGKTIKLRPKLNRYISGYHTYQRNDIVFAFVAKKQFADNGEESLLKITLDQHNNLPPIYDVHDKICQYVYEARHNNQVDGATDIFNTLRKLPRFILKMIFGFVKWLDYHNCAPDSLTTDDPAYSSVFLTNLGSIKLTASYHHLSNWGTNSFFVAIGEMSKKSTHSEREVQLIDTLNLGITIDERIADGYYFSKSFRLFRHLALHPELLEKPLDEEINWDDVK